MRENLIEEIKELITTSENDSIDINPKLLTYFTDEELTAMRDDLLRKKLNLREENAQWLVELYEKTKKD